MSSYPTYNREFQKNSKKFQKIKKTPLWLLFKPKKVGKDREREEIKKIVPLSSYKTRSRKFKKKSKKIEKIKKNTIMESFQANISWERPGKRENNKNRSN